MFHELGAEPWVPTASMARQSPAQRHLRRQVVKHPPLTARALRNRQSPATFIVRSSSAVRPLFVGKRHDRAISQSEVELQAVGSSYRPSVHALLQLVSNPAAKVAGPSTSFGYIYAYKET